MKKNIIIFLLGLLLIISGLLIGGIKELGNIFSRFVDSDIILFEDGYHGFTSTYDLNEVKELDLEINNAKVAICNDDVDKITLQVENAPNSIYFKLEENVLKVSSNVLFNLNNHKMDIKIYVPRDYMFNDVSMEVNGGVVELNNLVSQQLDIELNAGIIRGRNCMITKGYDIECNAGEIELINEDSLSQFGYDIDCNLGEVYVGNIHHSGFVENTSEYKDKMVNVECNLGKVDIRGN